MNFITSVKKLIHQIQPNQKVFKRQYLYSTKSIRQFSWDDTAKVVRFLNEASGSMGTEKEVSESLFKDWHSMPGGNPIEDCFISIDETDKESINGFIHFICEPTIDRIVAIQTVKPHTNRRKITTDFEQLARHYQGNRSLKFIHVQIARSDPEWSSTLNDSGWVKVKEYMNLRCDPSDTLDFPEYSLPEKFSIAPLDPEIELSEFTKLQNEAFGEHWGFSPNTEEEISKRISMERSGEEGILVIKENNKLAGYNWTLFASNGFESTGWVSMTGVAPEFRGRRLGRAVVTAGMNYLIGKNVGAIELEVDSENLPARQLYASLGFKMISETEWYQLTSRNIS